MGRTCGRANDVKIDCPTLLVLYWPSTLMPLSCDWCATQSGDHLAAQRNNITSPGGASAAALYVSLRPCGWGPRARVSVCCLCVVYGRAFITAHP